MDKNSIEIKMTGKRVTRFLGACGVIAFGFAIWRTSWVAFAVGVTCWFSAIAIGCIAIAIAVLDARVKSLKDEQKPGKEQ